VLDNRLGPFTNTGRIMSILKRLTIKQQLVFGLALLISTVIALGSFSFYQMSTLSHLTEDVFDHPFTVTRSSLTAEVELTQLEILVEKNRHAIIQTQETKDDIHRLEKLVMKELLLVQDRVLGKEAQKQITSSIAHFEDWIVLEDDILKIKNLETTSAQDKIDLAEDKLHELNKELNKVIEFSVHNAEAFRESSEEIRKSAVSTGLGIILFAVAFGILIAIVLLNNILKPINTLTRSIVRIEKESDLTARVNIGNKTEIAQTAKAINDMLGKFQSSLNQVSDVVLQLSATSEQTSAITEQTTAAVKEQSDKTQLLATASHQMSQSIRDVASNANSASESTIDINSRTQQGLEAMQDTIEEIGILSKNVGNAGNVIAQVEQNSEEIGSILDVIQGIAEQTNLLALNAAIEAARAGEQGRGFAVVADEVRNLASKTQASTEEINRMILKLQTDSREAVSVMEESQNTASSATDKAKMTSDILLGINTAIHEINEQNALIASSTEEQSAVTDDIYQNVNQISEMTKQTNIGAEQTKEASLNLKQLAHQLKDLIKQFKVS